MKKYKWIVILVNLLLILVYINWSIGSKESLLDEGELVLIELAPVDPRSIMQGDYMNLRYKLAKGLDVASLSKRGYCVVSINPDKVGSILRYQQNTIPLEEGEKLIKYTKKSQNTLYLGADSFFFQEGQAEKYEKAKYGALKIDSNGNSLLVGLYDTDLKAIE